MKKFQYIFLLFIITLISCEDVIHVDLPTENPRLVIDAAINWENRTSGNEQKIRLTTTTGYYENQVPAVIGAEVFITNLDNNEIFQFIENEDDGYYICNDFNPILNARYELTVKHDGSVYTATEQMTQGVDIDKIEQKNNGGFTGEDIEIKVFYTDNGATENYYMIKYEPDFSVIPFYSTSEDKFYQGNQFNGIFMHEDIKSGISIDITLYGISKQYFNYMELLDGIIDGGGPFGTTPAKVKGNIINQTSFENFAFGYFSLSEIRKQTYNVE